MHNGKPETVRDINPTEYITQFDLDDKDLTVQIADVQIDDLPVAGTSKTQSRGVLIIKGAPVNKMVLNKTNIKIIANLYGGELSKWADNWITIYRDPSIRFGPKKTGGIRVRPNKPTPPRQESQAPKPKQQVDRLSGILKRISEAPTEHALASITADAAQLSDDDKAIAMPKYKERRAQIRAEATKDQAEPEPQQEPEQSANDFGPPMDDIDPELFPDAPATGRVE